MSQIVQLDGRTVYNRIRNEFNTETVIESYKLNEVLDLHRRYKLMDFLPQILTRDLDIMESWKDHFKERGVAFAVGPRRSNPDQLVLWKELIARGGRDDRK